MRYVLAAILGLCLVACGPDDGVEEDNRPVFAWRCGGTFDCTYNGVHTTLTASDIVCAATEEEAVAEVCAYVAGSDCTCTESCVKHPEYRCP